MRENVWKSFRFTNRTARLSLLWGVLVPVGVFALCQQEDVSRQAIHPSAVTYADIMCSRAQLKWDILGAKKDQPLARFGPSSQPKPAPAEDDE